MPSTAGWIPAPSPDTAQLWVKLANLVPEGQWVTDGDLGEAAGMGPASKSARAVAFALSFAPTGRPAAERAVPWHRIRLEDGHLSRVPME